MIEDNLYIGEPAWVAGLEDGEKDERARIVEIVRRHLSEYNREEILREIEGGGNPAGEPTGAKDVSAGEPSPEPLKKYANYSPNLREFVLRKEAAQPTTEPSQSERDSVEQLRIAARNTPGGYPAEAELLSGAADELAALRAKNTKILAEWDRIFNELSARKRDVIDLTAKCERLAAENEGLESEMAEILTERMASQKRYSALIKDLRAQLDKAVTALGYWRLQVRTMATAMEANLRKHDADRGPRGWVGDDPDALLQRVRDEVDELEYAVDHDTANILAEAADVANMAMMVADVDGMLAEIREEGLNDDVVRLEP